MTSGAQGEDILIPVIDGAWWQISGNPDLGEYTTKNQEPVDFGIWQAADGTWQLWSCIRNTRCGEKTRLFHRWEGQRLTDTNWKPMGIAMEANTDLGETSGGLQAPHVVLHDGLYYMAYGDWANICFATSEDGKQFERVIQPDGTTAVFSEGPGRNTRDAMLIQIDGLWHCYYTAFSPSHPLLPDLRAYIFCRTSSDLKNWSDSCVVCYGGRPGTGALFSECPHVVEPEPGHFFLFRNQYYGKNALNWVYSSGNPLNFGIDDDVKLVRNWRLAAPEILYHEGQYYIAALRNTLDGINMARLKWVRVPELGEPVFDFDSDATASSDAWQLKKGALPAIFTDSTADYFCARTKYFICTAELGDGSFSDEPTGTIESPSFTLDAERYFVLASGGKDPARLYVAIIDAGTGEELMRTTGDDTNGLREHAFNCAEHAGKEVFVRIVDASSDPWGHISFGGVYAESFRRFVD